MEPRIVDADRCKVQGVVIGVLRSYNYSELPVVSRQLPVGRLTFHWQLTTGNSQQGASMPAATLSRADEKSVRSDEKPQRKILFQTYFKSVGTHLRRPGEGRRHWKSFLAALGDAVEGIAFLDGIASAAGDARPRGRCHDGCRGRIIGHGLRRDWRRRIRLRARV